MSLTNTAANAFMTELEKGDYVVDEFSVENTLDEEYLVLIRIHKNENDVDEPEPPETEVENEHKTKTLFAKMNAYANKIHDILKEEYLLTDETLSPVRDLFLTKGLPQSFDETGVLSQATLKRLKVLVNKELKIKAD